MVPSVVTNQIARAQSRLTQQFRLQPNCQNILAALLTGVPEVEALYWQIINTRILSNLVTMVATSQNTGDQLDIIGGLVGVTRQGRTDAAYLPAIQVQIFVNRSQGRGEDIIHLMKLFGVDFSYSEDSSAQAFFRVDAYGVTDIQVPIIQRAIMHAREAGTRGFFAYTSLPRAPVVSGGHDLSGPMQWNVTNWADTIGSTDLATWTSSVSA